MINKIIYMVFLMMIIGPILLSIKMIKGINILCNNNNNKN